MRSWNRVTQSCGCEPIHLVGEESNVAGRRAEERRSRNGWTTPIAGRSDKEITHRQQGGRREGGGGEGEWEHRLRWVEVREVK